MSERSITRITRKREERRSKAKNGTGCPGSNVPGSVVIFDSLEDPMLTWRTKDQPSSSIPRKRKRTSDRDLSLGETDNIPGTTYATELVPHKNNHHDKNRTVSVIERLIGGFRPQRPFSRVHRGTQILPSTNHSRNNLAEVGLNRT